MFPDPPIKNNPGATIVDCGITEKYCHPKRGLQFELDFALLSCLSWQELGRRENEKERGGVSKWF